LFGTGAGAPYTRRRMPYQLPPDPRTERRTRIAHLVSFASAAVLVALVVYFGYIGYEGSRQLADAPAPTSDCRTPAMLSWDYEAINYDIEADDALADEADRESCSAQGTAAGDELSGPDGVPLAGWYIPAGIGSGPTGPTVIVAHGWGSNKSNMLDRAAILHEEYNLVLFDFRNHGQSGEASTTQGVREAGDLRAVIDWLESAKGPRRIAVLGVSMGGASALNEADRDERVDALIIESTHATLANAIQARLNRGGSRCHCPAAGPHCSERSSGRARMSAPLIQCRQWVASTSVRSCSSAVEPTSPSALTTRPTCWQLPRQRGRPPRSRSAPMPVTPSLMTHARETIAAGC